MRVVVLVFSLRNSCINLNVVLVLFELKVIHFLFRVYNFYHSFVQVLRVILEHAVLPPVYSFCNVLEIIQLSVLAIELLLKFFDLIVMRLRFKSNMLLHVKQVGIIFLS